MGFSFRHLPDRPDTVVTEWEEYRQFSSCGLGLSGSSTAAAHSRRPKITTPERHTSDSRSSDSANERQRWLASALTTPNLDEPETSIVAELPAMLDIEPTSPSDVVCRHRCDVARHLIDTPTFRQCHPNRLNTQGSPMTQVLLHAAPAMLLAISLALGGCAPKMVRSVVSFTLKSTPPILDEPLIDTSGHYRQNHAHYQTVTIFFVDEPEAADSALLREVEGSFVNGGFEVLEVRQVSKLDVSRFLSKQEEEPVNTDVESFRNDFRRKIRLKQDRCHCLIGRAVLMSVPLPYYRLVRYEQPDSNHRHREPRPVGLPGRQRRCNRDRE